MIGHAMTSGGQCISPVFLRAKDYSIADIAAWPWVWRYERQSIDLNDFGNVLCWYRAIAEWPAVQRGHGVPHSEDIPIPRDR